MVIGLLLIEIHFPHSTSLKEKRAALSGFKEKIRNRFNVALAEVANQDKWQLASLAFVTINNEKDIVDQTLEKIIQEAEINLEGEIIHSKIVHL
ncbi:MAG: DUF503 domain-containing protein [Candidatus Aminicenantes bacterium]|nr:DUF503 domain-containing protein [Candidatus Aminicenantes bacterium]